MVTVPATCPLPENWQFSSLLRCRNVFSAPYAKSMHRLDLTNLGPMDRRRSATECGLAGDATLRGIRDRGSRGNRARVQRPGLRRSQQDRRLPPSNARGPDRSVCPDRGRSERFRSNRRCDAAVLRRAVTKSTHGTGRVTQARVFPHGVPLPTDLLPAVPAMAGQL